VEEVEVGRKEEERRKIPSDGRISRRLKTMMGTLFLVAAE